MAAPSSSTRTPTLSQARTNPPQIKISNVQTCDSGLGHRLQRRENTHTVFFSLFFREVDVLLCSSSI
ncbi:hypothetical protein RHMOL_Rhmol09G0117300 [Rhododendron molle]|uniref:Uncharacterized protein n=1 Tax=Rhododendron molle TaxID=49168 RepID=A0ACC0MC27_RHOML|nr:hypothetical protein RHMOL_Rhmol09G0117300 [Rhododendron molle]